MEHTNTSKRNYKHSLWVRLWYLLITLCLMVPFLVGAMVFVLGLMPILCVCPVLYMGWKTVQVSKRLLEGTTSELKAQKSPPPSESTGQILRAVN